MEIEEFGLPNVDSAADVTDLQTTFIAVAREIRKERINQRHG